MDCGPASRLGSQGFLTMGRSLTPSSYLRTVLLERKTMPLQGCHTLSRRASRSLGEDLLGSYMMRMLDESLSGSSAPSWLETLRGFKSLPSYMVPRVLESQRSSIFWSFYSKAIQLHSMQELLDQSQISSRPALSVRVRSWPSIKMETSPGSRLMDFLTAWWPTRRS